MNEIAIRVDGISKQYRIGAQQHHYRTLRDSMRNIAGAPVRALKSTFRRSNKGIKTTPETIWALKDVSFEVKTGDIVGIIGSNGAGKSTLLKILSRITDPTEGTADITGRIGSLLEVGTGFHPELTGRENIYLNGAILGMKRRELNLKYDEIISFAEIEKFADTPVKHYSSGMYLRLAFAVAAHLEPNILLVDEVLAVGDASFQNKCIGKMGDVAKEGRTVLFVSHNMGAIRALCNKGIALRNGKVFHDGSVAGAIEAYYKAIGIMPGGDVDVSGNGPQSRFGPILLNGGLGNSIRQGEEFELSTTLRLPEEVTGFAIHCFLEFVDGFGIATVSQDSSSVYMESLEDGVYRITVEFPTLWLAAGLYSVYFKAFLRTSGSGAKHVSDRFPLDVEGDSSLTQALLQPRVNWRIQAQEEPAVSVPSVR